MFVDIVCKECGTVTQRHSNAAFCFDCLYDKRRLQRNRDNGSVYRPPPNKSLRKRAASAIATAIVRGDLQRLSHVVDIDHDIKCVDCGEKAQCWDHRDYAKPLDVEPVCARCNVLRGPGLNKG